MFPLSGDSDAPPYLIFWVGSTIAYGSIFPTDDTITVSNFGLKYRFESGLRLFPTVSVCFHPYLDPRTEHALG